MFVENQPLKPIILLLSPGARIVFMSVCPVLKSFPAMGTFFFLAKSVSAGTSTDKLGAPFAYGTPH